MSENKDKASLRSIFSPLTNIKVIIITSIVGFIVFGNMLFNDFVWDDKTFIISNPGVHSVNIPYLFSINLFNDTVYYRPIPALYSAILYSVATVNVFPYHLLQLIIHITCSFFLFLIFSKFIKKNISLFLSLIFLVHPMNVESVSFIAQTVSPLFFLFGIVALLLAVGKKFKYSYFFICFFLLLSLLTKETGILFTELVVLYSFLYKSRNKLQILSASVVAVVLYFFIRFGIGHVFFDKSLLIAPIANAPLPERLLTMPAIAFYYIKTFILPLNLSINQHWVVSLSGHNFYLLLLVNSVFLIMMILFGIYLFRHSRKMWNAYLFFSAWFLLGILFHLQFVPLDMTVADRWFYFPLAGLLGTIGIVLSYKPFGSKTQKALIVAFIMWIAFLSIRTIVRNTNWKDAKTLYVHDMQVSNNFELENNLGWELIQDGSYKKAISHLKNSTEMNPSWDRSWYNLGVAYHFNENSDDAKRSYEKALSLNKNNVQVIENLSYLLLFYYDLQAAKQTLEKAVKEYPARPKLWYFLSLTNYKLENKDEALENIKRAYQLNPSDKDIVQIYYLLQNNLPIEFK